MVISLELSESVTIFNAFPLSSFLPLFWYHLSSSAPCHGLVWFGYRYLWVCPAAAAGPPNMNDVIPSPGLNHLCRPPPPPHDQQHSTLYHLHTKLSFYLSPLTIFYTHYFYLSLLLFSTHTISNFPSPFSMHTISNFPSPFSTHTISIFLSYHFLRTLFLTFPHHFLCTLFLSFLHHLQRTLYLPFPLTIFYTLTFHLFLLPYSTHSMFPSYHLYYSIYLSHLSLVLSTLYSIYFVYLFLLPPIRPLYSLPFSFITCSTVRVPLFL